MTQITKHASMLHGEGALLRSPPAQLVATSATAERAAATASRPPDDEEGLKIPQDISADASDAARDLLDTSLVEQGAPLGPASTSTITSETVSTSAQKIIRAAGKEVRPQVTVAAQQRLQVRKEAQAKGGEGKDL